LKQAAHLAAKTFTHLGLDILLWKIDVGLDPGEEIEQTGTDFHETLPESARQGSLGGEQSALGAGMEDVEDGFSLGEIDPAVEKGPFGELPRASHPGSLAVNGLQDGFHDQRVAVAADFDQVLAGVGAGTGPQRDDGLIQELFFQVETTGDGLARGQGLPGEIRGNGGGLGPTDPNQRQGGNSRGSGTGSDGVFFESHEIQSFQKQR
jgi:hypothetical protein